MEVSEPDRYYPQPRTLHAASELGLTGAALMPSGVGVLGLLVVDGELDEAVQVGQAGVAAAAAPSLQQLALGIKADDAPRGVRIGSRGIRRTQIGRRAA